MMSETKLDRWLRYQKPGLPIKGKPKPRISLICGKLDRSIASLIYKLNEAGYRTHTSCSGVKADHPKGRQDLEGYISFLQSDLTADQQERIRVAAKTAKMRFEEYHISPYPDMLFVYIPKNAEPEQFWLRFEDALLGAHHG